MRARALRRSCNAVRPARLPLVCFGIQFNKSHDARPWPFLTDTSGSTTGSLHPPSPHSPQPCPFKYSFSLGQDLRRSMEGSVRLGHRHIFLQPRPIVSSSFARGLSPLRNALRACRQSKDGEFEIPTELNAGFPSFLYTLLPQTRHRYSFWDVH